MQKITPFLWFDNNAEEAMNFYTSVFKDSKILTMNRNPPDGPGEEGSVLVGEFEIAGMRFMALNGGPLFKFNESVSFMIHCDDQAEVDYYWEALSADGGQTVECGWLKDKFGLAWQIVPKRLGELLSDPDPEKQKRVFQAVWSMQKLDVQRLEDAYAGKV